MEELKKCPFCGSEAVVLYVEDGRYYVECGLYNGHCEVIPSTWLYDTKEKAIQAWNRRVEE